MKAKGILSIIISGILLSSCYKNVDREVRRKVRVPIYEYTTEEAAEAGLKQGEPVALTTFGNIYVYQQYLLVNERGKGIHIYDNSNPSAPAQVSFMNIPGNLDMAIRNNVLYADSYDDLIALDITDLNNISLLKRIDDVFPMSHPRFNGTIVGYRDTVIIETEQIQSGFGRQDDDDVIFLADTESANSGGGSIGNGESVVGTGGSFARFTIAQEHLFAIDDRSLNVFDLFDEKEPVKVSSTPIFEVMRIETLFPYKNSLFIGSTDGMIVYDISDPKNIAFQSMFTHARACDPVYVEDDVAYVTLRSNNIGLNNCGGNSNQLDVIDVSTLDNPVLIKSFDMIDPHGVGVDDNLLFVCEANSGLKIYEMDKEFNGADLVGIELDQISWNQSIFAYDVIPLRGTLIVVGENELHQYSYKDPSNISLLSKIE